jgi:hypothetical protein
MRMILAVPALFLRPSQLLGALGIEEKKRDRKDNAQSIQRQTGLYYDLADAQEDGDL